MAKKCPSCGKTMNSHETFWDCDNCGEFIVKKGYETKEERGEQIPFGCSACGNPAYPDCKLSCNLFDD
ncbi:MAG: hypothetical protein PHG07_01380 [Lachnospiraceae bacterium]|nr:hypothetical protein [Lachnospiraceae bacterium]